MKRLLLVSFLMCILFVVGLSKDVLHMYTALDENEWPIYVKAFEEATGIDVQVVRMSSGELLARVEAEANNPQASIWFGGPAVDQKSSLSEYQKTLVGGEIIETRTCDQHTRCSFQRSGFQRRPFEWSYHG